VGGCVLEAFGYNGGMDKKAQLNALKGSSKKPLTLDGLVGYSQKVLLPAIEQSMDKRFEKVDKRFDGQDKRLDEHEKQIKTLQGSVDEMRDQVLTKLDENTVLLEKISQEQDITSATHVRRDKAIEGHEERIVRLEKKAGIEQVVVS